jgi:hypothetical protein
MNFELELAPFRWSVRFRCIGSQSVRGVWALSSWGITGAIDPNTGRIIYNALVAPPRASIPASMRVTKWRSAALRLHNLTAAH